MRELVIQTLMGAIGSVGFAIVFNVRGKKLLLQEILLLCATLGFAMKQVLG